MHFPSQSFVLRSTATSPFGRKVRMAIEILGLSKRVTIEPADTLDENDSLRQQNPLGKMPCLLLGDGTALYDSRIIIEFLQEVAGSEQLLPARGLARYQTLTRAALADGIMDASILVVYEGRFRDPAMYSERWLKHQRDKIIRGLSAFVGTLPDPTHTDIGSIGFSCALGYLDWRKPIEWRTPFPQLAAWLAEFGKHEPAFEQTRAPS